MYSSTKHIVLSDPRLTFSDVSMPRSPTGNPNMVQLVHRTQIFSKNEPLSIIMHRADS